MSAFTRKVAEEVTRQLRGARQASLDNHRVTGGRVFYVLKTAATNYTQFVEDHPPYKSSDGVVTTPAVYNTVDEAIGACTADQGDVIYVMPGHTETVTSTSIDVDVAGISIICLGNGQNAPYFTYDSAAATIKIDANDVTWQGGWHFGSFADVASAFTVAAGKNFTLDGGYFEDEGASLNFLSIVTTGATDNEADYLEVKNCTWLGLNTTPLAFVSILAAEQSPYIHHNHVQLAATSGGEFITLADKVVTGIRIMWNEHNVVGATGTTTGIFLTGSGTSTGTMAYNLCGSLDTTAELIVTAGTGIKQFENYYTGTADKSAKLWPVVDAA